MSGQIVYAILCKLDWLNSLHEIDALETFNQCGLREATAVVILVDLSRANRIFMFSVSHVSNIEKEST